MKIKIYLLVTDTDDGTLTFSFSTRQEAETAYIRGINRYLDESEKVETFAEALKAYEHLIEKGGCIDTIYIDEQEITFGPKAPAEGLKRFYVVKSWENFPEGGTCGEIIWATDHEDAEAQMIDIMKFYRDDDDTYQEHWHTIDCWPLDDFIKNQIQPG